MKTLIFGGFILAAAMLAGCASSPVPIGNAKPVPEARYSALAASWLQPCADCGELIIVRDDGTMASAAISLPVYVDGKRTATLWPAEKMTLYLPAGFHRMVSPQPKEGKPVAGFMVKAGHTTVFRLSVNPMSNTPYFIEVKHH